MDGSIADSTVLRMRTQLQRMHHASPTNSADGFLEELLKLPASSAVDQADDAQPADEPLDSLPTIGAAQTDKDKKRSEEEPADRDESVDDGQPAPCVPLCYGPAPTAVPQTVEPTVEPDTAVAVAEPAVVQTAVVDQPTDQPVAVTETTDIVDNAVAAPVVEEPTNDELVQPIESNVQPLVKDNLSRAVRDGRRTKEARDKSDAPIERPQAVARQPAAPVAEQSQVVEAKTNQDQQVAAEQAQATIVQAEAQSNVANDRQPTRNEDRSQRDKWYETSQAGNDGVGQSSPSERVQEILGDQKDETIVDKLSVENSTELNATDVDVSPLLNDASAQVALDSSQIASDMLASVQANLAQNATTQVVTESSSAAAVDAGARGRVATPSMSVNATNGTRSTSSNAATGANESADAPREITQQERVRLVQRVARSFSRLGPEGGQVTLKLHPPQLGVLNVSIKIEGQTMTARLQTETSAARDAIVENLPLLRDRLSEQGIEIEQFQVEVGQQEDMANSGGQTGNFSGSNANSQQDNSSSATEFDYRRVARGNSSRQNIVVPIVSEPKLQSWSAPGRSLDVKA